MCQHGTPLVRLSRVVPVLISSMIIAACSFVSDGRQSQAELFDHSDVSSVGAVVHDQKHWALPTDPYNVLSLSDFEAHAYELRHIACMRGYGVDELSPRWDVSAPDPETLANNGSSILFNEELAAKYGYRQAPDPGDLLEDEILAAGDHWILESQSDRFHEVYELCHDEIQEEFSKSSHVEGDEESASIIGQFDKLAVDLTSEPLASAALLWRTCMAPQGIADLPDHPWRPGTLPESLHDRWDWRPAGAATEDEIAVATADATCRRSSGWFDALYEAEWNLHAAFVEEHRDELEALRRKRDEDEARYRSIIAEETAV